MSFFVFVFYQVEWGGAVEHDSSTMRGFIRVNGEEKWNMATAEKYPKVLDQEQEKSTGSSNSGKVLDQATVEKYRISAHCSCTASETPDLLPLKRSVGLQI